MSKVYYCVESVSGWREDSGWTYYGDVTAQSDFEAQKGDATMFKYLTGKIKISAVDKTDGEKTSWIVYTATLDTGNHENEEYLLKQYAFEKTFSIYEDGDPDYEQPVEKVMEVVYLRKPLRGFMPDEIISVEIVDISPMDFDKVLF